jgi:hypothetical protein
MGNSGTCTGTVLCTVELSSKVQGMTPAWPKPCCRLTFVIQMIYEDNALVLYSVDIRCRDCIDTVKLLMRHASAKLLPQKV